MTARSSPIPPMARTIHVIGDIHLTTSGAFKTRADILKQDLDSPALPAPAHRVQVGDLVNDTTVADATAIAYMDSLAASPKAGMPRYDLIVGNHDLWDASFNPSRTAAAWATAYGYASKNRTRDLGWCKLIFIGQDAAGAGTGNASCTLSAATLTYLDTELGNTTQPCLVFCHAPLYNTVQLGPGEANYSSTQAQFSVEGATPGSDADIRAILAAHTTAKAWISGHTHSPLAAPGLMTTVTLGGRSVAVVNAAAVAYVGATNELYDPICTPYLTVYSDRIEVRWRNHGAGAWVNAGGARVTRLAIG